MIIKDKPFHVSCCQAMLCWYYASPVVAGLAISSPSGCEVDLVRRWPGFVKLEAYQVRLVGYLVRNRAFAKSYGVSEKTAVSCAFCDSLLGGAL